MTESRTAVAAVVDALLREQSTLRTGEVMERTGLSRYTVHRRLRELTDQGLLVLEGRGRGAHYRPPQPHPRNEAAGAAPPEDAPVLHLAAQPEEWASRSQARQLLAGHVHHPVVVLDFHGVDRIGLGFADELFRVIAEEHPTLRLQTVNTSPGVELTVEQARMSAPVLPASPQRALPAPPRPPLLRLEPGWSARLLELSRRDGRAQLELVAPGGTQRLRVTLEECKEMRLPSSWVLQQPRVAVEGGGTLLFEDPGADVLVRCGGVRLGS